MPYAPATNIYSQTLFNPCPLYVNSFDGYDGNRLYIGNLGLSGLQISCY